MPDAAPPPRPTPKQGAATPPSRRQRVQAQTRAAGDTVVEGIERNPLAALAAGAAVGLAAGALLPKTRTETRYLGSFGAALNQSAIEAAKAAGDAGKAELTAIGISKVGANEQLGRLIDGLGGALKSAGTAARDSRRGRAASED